ncbi:hypothetical protein F4678DRAFT_456894 [Xylaria arbuscula]|nr:hypothetical protein F4678DRAFT_456894 [Xylaria arbuscula]
MSPYEPLKLEADIDEALSSSPSPQSYHKDVYPAIRTLLSIPIFRRWPVAEITLVLHVLSNAAWILKSLSREPGELDYFGGPDKILVPFDHDWLNLTDEGMGGVRYADDKWKGMIPPGGGSVSVSEDLVSKYGLAPGAKSTQREGEMHYHIAGYHQLHCLSVIRDQLYEPSGLTSMSDLAKRDHVIHCVEAIQQALYCFLDPTLINLETEWPHVPNGQRHVCRNRDALASWAEAHRSGMPGEEDEDAMRFR